MAKRLVESEDVSRIANDIRDRGEQPTALNIYDELGRGSLTTITKFLKEWITRDENQQAENLPVEIEVPIKLQAQSSKWIKALWNCASIEAEQNFEDMKIAVKTEVEEISELLNESQIFCERQNVKLLTAQSEIDLQVEQLASGAQDLEDKNSIIGSLRKINNDLQLEVSVLKAEADKDAALIADLKQAESLINNENKSLSTKVESIDGANKQLTEEKNQLQETNNTLSLEMKELFNKIDIINNEKSILNTEKSTLQARFNDIEKQLSRIEKKNLALEEKNEKLQAEILGIAKFRVIDSKAEKIDNS